MSKQASLFFFKYSLKKGVFQYLNSALHLVGRNIDSLKNSLQFDVADY